MENLYLIIFQNNITKSNWKFTNDNCGKLYTWTRTMCVINHYDRFCAK